MVKIMTTGPVVLARSGGKGKRSRYPSITVTVSRDEFAILRTVMRGCRPRLHAVTSFRPPRVRLPPRPGGPRGGTSGRRPGAACARLTSAA